MRLIGRRVLVYDELPSTNDAALAMANDIANAGTVIVASHQTAGRGQHGRVWQSRPGASLLMSVLIFPPPELRRPVVLTAWAAVAVANAVRQLTGVDCQMKWPNDLLVDGKKICGILIEQKAIAEGAATTLNCSRSVKSTISTVVGIGLNINQSNAEFEAANLPNAISLIQIHHQELTLRDCIDAVVMQLDSVYSSIQNNDLVELEAAWIVRLRLLGREVRADLTDGTSLVGQVISLGFNGIELVTNSGVRHVLLPERIRQLT